MPRGPYKGRYARSIESGWLGKVIAVELHGDERMLKMMGVETLCLAVAGGSFEDWLCPEDIQWFSPNDVRFTKAR